MFTCWLFKGQALLLHYEVVKKSTILALLDWNTTNLHFII